MSKDYYVNVGEEFAFVEVLDTDMQGEVRGVHTDTVIPKELFVKCYNAWILGQEAKDGE